MLMALHEHGVQRPIKILARADAGDFQSFQSIEHGARSDGDPGGAQRARKIDDVFGEPAGTLPLPAGERVGVRGFGLIDHLKFSCTPEPLTRRAPRAGLSLRERRFFTPPLAVPISPDRVAP